MKNTDFMNLSLPEGADKIDVEILNNDFKKLENEAIKHYIQQRIEVDGTATIIGSVGPYVQLENLTDNILNVNIGDEIVVLMKGDNRKIRTITNANFGIVTSGAVKVTYYINAQTYADENFYKKEKVDELLSNVEATIEVDAELSETSENPVQNKVITAELANYATTAEVESKVTEKVAEIVAGAPEDFDTLKEMSDWLLEHEDSAATMNSAIQKNKTDIETANTNIAKNTVDIATANTNIANNTADIEQNTTDIANNTAELPFKSVSGQLVTVETDGTVMIDCVRNLLNIPDKTATAASYVFDYSINSISNMQFLEPGAYTIHFTQTVSDKDVLLTIKNRSGTSILYKLFNNVTDVSFNFTIKENGYQINMWTNGEITMSNFMLEKGKVAHSYVPYSSYLVTVCGKNLVNQAAGNKTENGVTFTKNSDNSVTVNGTATADANYYFNGAVNLPVGNYICSGCPAGGNAARGYSMYFGTTNSFDIGSGYRITNDTPTQARILIRSGTTVNNLVFYPMIRLLSETDNTYSVYKGETIAITPDTTTPVMAMSKGSVTNVISPTENIVTYALNSSGKNVLNKCYEIEDIKARIETLEGTATATMEGGE